MDTIFELPRPDQTIWAQIELAKTDRKTLETVIGKYIPVVRNALKRAGLSEDDCEDAGQEFLAGKFLRTLHQADQQKGKFRSFLLNAVDWYMGDWHRRQSAEKRGRNLTSSLELMDESGSHLAGSEAPVASDIDTDFAFSIHDEVMGLMHAEYSRRNQTAMFSLLGPWLFDKEKGLDRTLAEQTRMEEATIRKALSRFRTRYKEHFMEQIRILMDKDEDPAAEMMELLKLLVRRGDRLQQGLAGK